MTFVRRLDQLWRAGGRRFAAEPIEDRPPGLGVGHQEVIEQGRAGRGQQRRQPAKGLGVGGVAGGGDQALQAGEARADNLLPPELVTGQLQEQARLVVF